MPAALSPVADSAGSQGHRRQMLAKVEDVPAPELLPDAEEAGADDLSLDDDEKTDSDREEEDDDEEEEGDDDYGGAGAWAGAGRGAGHGKPPLRKGPWTSEEDRRLKEYVEAHGEGNWNQVQRNAGLNRCGKSCRLRWANHLRPDLKKGPFEPDEVDLIVKLHIKWGNKWAKMALHLPGRTDNEIKNFWNTRLKRHQRAGLPIYPEYLLSQSTDEDMNCHTPDESRGRKRSNESSEEEFVTMDDLMDAPMTFEHLDYNKDPVFPEPLKHIPMDPTMSLKRYASMGNLMSVQTPYETDNTFCSTGLNYVFPKSQSVPLGNAIASGSPIFNGNPSTSGTVHRSMKTELPSFQCSKYSLSNDLLFQRCPASPSTPIFNGNPSTSGTVHRSMKTELPSFQCSKYSLSNDWLFQCRPASPIEQQIETFIQSTEPIPSQNSGNLIPNIDVLGGPTDPERFFQGCPSVELQGSNSPPDLDPLYPLGTGYLDGGMPDTSLDASLNDYLYPKSLFDEELKHMGPLWLDSSAWKNMPGSSHKPDF